MRLGLAEAHGGQRGVRRAGFGLALLVAALVFAVVARAEGPGASWETRVEAAEKLRTGDILAITLPGEPALNRDFQIDRNGQVMLPEVGAVTVSGETLQGAGDIIRNSLGRVLRDVQRLNVSIRDRRLLVTVAGYVQKPGVVDLPAEATVQTAIVAAGGLAEGAQLDRVQLQRDGQTRSFDYKRFLDTGDFAILPALAPLDIIFVPSSPVVGNVFVNFDGRTLAQAGDGGDERASIKIFGEVNSPASYSFKPGATIIDMLLRAGGVTRYGAVEQIRVISDGQPVFFDLQRYLDTGDAKLLPALAEGATIFVPRQTDDVKAGKRTVYVMGEVAKPGAYEAPPGASFVEILANSGGPTRFADTRQVRIIRADSRVELVDIVRYTETGTPVPPAIQPGDAIFVPEKKDTTEPSWLKIPPQRAIHVLGAVQKPGRFEWSDEMSLFDLIATAGGPSPRGDLANVQILENSLASAKSVTFNMQEFISRGGRMSDVPRLKAGYVILVPELPVSPIDNKAQWVKLQSDNTIYIMGEVGRPGRYAFNSTMNFLDILTAADGPTAKADLSNIRVSFRKRSAPAVQKVDLARYFLTGDASLLPRLRTGDVIFVPDSTQEFLDAPRRDVVYVLGAVNRPGKYPFSDHMSVLDLLAQAGGPTASSLQSRILVVNMSGRQTQSRYFDLLRFAKTADITLLPVIRPGDAIYVPEENHGDLRTLANTMRDLMTLVSPYTLLQGGGSE